MKQLDTIKNHEWIPTELDLENMPRVTSALPTASAQNLGMVYLLDAEQLGYVRSHFYKCIVEDNIYKWYDLQVGRFAIGNCRNIQLELIDDGINLKLLIAWEDPDDVVVGDETTRWAKTVLVHQVGHMPLTVDDGVVLLTNTTRNAYSTFGGLSFTIQDNSTGKHYFKLFPYSDDGAITNDDQNGRVAGFNYVVTNRRHPYVMDASNQPQYDEPCPFFSRVLNPDTGLYEYARMSFTSAYFTDGGTDTETGKTKWEFSAGKTYYVYENCLINWAGIQSLVKNGTAEQYFPVGSILMLPYHGDYGTMAFEVVDFDNVESFSGGTGAHTMTLQAKYLYEWWDYYNVGYVFDEKELAAVRTKDTGLNSSKVYHVAVGNGNATITMVPPTSWADGGTKITNVANTIATACGKYLHPVSHRNATRAPLQATRVYTNSGAWYIGTPSEAWASGSSSNNATYVECELSYLTAMDVGYADKVTRRDFRRTVTGSGSSASVPAVTNATATTVNGTDDASIKYNRRMIQWPTENPYIPSASIQDITWYLTKDSSYIYGKPYATASTYVNKRGMKFVNLTNRATNAGVGATGVATSAADIETVVVTRSAVTVESNAQTLAGDTSHVYMFAVSEAYLKDIGTNFAAKAEYGGNDGSAVPNKILLPILEFSTATDLVDPTDPEGTVNGLWMWCYEHGLTRKKTSDAKFVADKVYYARSGEEFELLVAGTDYQVNDNVTSYSTAHDNSVIYEELTQCTLYRAAVAKSIFESFRPLYNQRSGESGGVTTTTSAEASTTSTVAEIKDPAAAYSVWGAGADALHNLPFQMNNFSPRNNQYADYLMRVPYVNGSRGYDSLIKYLAPAGLMKSLSVAFTSKKAKYTMTRSCELRDISKDVADVLFDLVKFAVSVAQGGSDSDAFRYIGGVEVSQSDLANYIEVSGNSYTSATWKYDNIWRNLINVPTTDLRYLNGKRYLRAHYKKQIPGYQSNWDSYGYFVRRRTVKISDLVGEGNENLPWNDNTVPTVEIFQRCTPGNVAKRGAAGSGDVWYDYNDDTDPVYQLTYREMTPCPADDDYCLATGYLAKARAGVNYFSYDGSAYTPVTLSEGDDASTYYVKYGEHVGPGTDGLCYRVGEPIPTRSLTPLYVHQRTKDSNGNVVNDDSSYIWSCDGGFTECTVDVCGQLVSDNNGRNTSGATGLLAGYPGYNSALCITDIYQSVVSRYTYTDNKTYEECSLFWAKSNTERVAYGNHVWSQSNLRAYLNGPFDTATEYVLTSDTTFKSNRMYYKFVAGKGFVPITSSEFVAGQSYVRLDNGLPIGAKLDIYNPTRYWNFGVSPIMQYKYVNNTWTEAFDTTDLWWGDGQKSVNNGLNYDNLAAMYRHSTIGRGSAGSPAYTVNNIGSKSAVSASPYTATGFGYSVANVGKIHDRSGRTIGTLDTRNTLPRQSFLHGFLDCQYFRTNDATPVEGKHYYQRNPYGEYVEVSYDGTYNPYSYGLYEENPNYKADLQDAYEFLNAICPVVNRNGLYGTTGAFDLYPHASPSVAPNLGGTTTVDKVWLASTNQVAGGTGANNGVYEEWSLDQNGKYSSLANIPKDKYGVTATGTTGHKYALQKYAMCSNIDWAYQAFGYTGDNANARLNASRVKYAYCNGVHRNGGYADVLGGAQYWWLRSAGGGSTMTPNMWMVKSNPTSEMGAVVRGYGHGHDAPFLHVGRLSPLITIG